MKSVYDQNFSRLINLFRNFLERDICRRSGENYEVKEYLNEEAQVQK